MYAALLGIGLLIVATTEATANETHHRLMKLDVHGRAVMLAMALKDQTTPACKVARTYFQGMAPQDVAIWNVGCADGRAYAVTIKNDRGGSTTVLDCKTLKVVARVSCFTKL